MGIALRLSNDPLAYFVDLYKRYGAIFRTNIINRNIIVMAGLEANRFLNTDGNRILDSEVLFGSFGRELGTDMFMTAMDGEAHLHLRKQMKSGYSRSAMIPHLARLIELVDEYTRTLRPGDTFAVLPVLQNLVTQQLGVVIARRMPNEYFEHLQRLLTFNLNVHVMKMWPSLAMRLPSYQKSKAKVLELAKQVLEDHRRNPNTDHPDLIDDLLASNDLNGKPYDEAMMLAATIGPYFAGIDTVASSLTFFVHNVLKHPDVQEAATAEADAMFTSAVPSLNDMKAMEILHGAAIETLRIHPVAPFTPRHTREEFEFGGHRVPAGSEIFFAQTVTHFLEEYFPDPHTFDATRFAKGQGKGVQGAFAPYALGAHLCLGAGIAETQMILIMARLLHNLRLELANPDSPLNIIATPLPNLGRGFRVRVVENRHP